RLLFARIDAMHSNRLDQAIADPQRVVVKVLDPAAERAQASGAADSGPDYGKCETKLLWGVLSVIRQPFAQTGSSVMLRAKSKFPTPWLARPTVITPAPSSQCAIFRPPASSGRSPRLSMNAATLALARASSPAMKTSGRPFSRTWRKMVLNAFTTLALAGAALA